MPSSRKSVLPKRRKIDRAAFGKRLTELAFDRRKSQADIVRALEKEKHVRKSKQAVSKWIRGLSFPGNAADLQNLADVLNTSVSFLCFETDDPDKKEDRETKIALIQSEDTMAHLEAIQVSLEKVTVNFRPGPRAFASVIYDDAWADKIEKGDVVVIDPDAFRVAPFLACIELKIFNKYIRTVRELQSRGADQFELIPKGGKRFASFLVNVTELTQNVSILGPIVKVIKSL